MLEAILLKMAKAMKGIFVNGKKPGETLPPGALQQGEGRAEGVIPNPCVSLILLQPQAF